MLLGCIADDLTGATDLALILTRAGMRTVQVMQIPPAGAEFAAFDAVIVALKSSTISWLRRPANWCNGILPA